MTSSNNLPRAVIFDMDGVLVDSNPFHVQKWADFLDSRGIRYDPRELPRKVLGPPNDDTFRLFLGPSVTKEEMAELGEELETRFRATLRAHAKPLPGVESLLRQCQQARIPMAVASSAIAKNVEFVVELLGFRDYFRCLLTADEVHHPKPHPEIYLRTCEKLGHPPAACVVFEDSFVGIEAAKAAGIKCVAVASTFPAEELRAHGGADLIVPGFEHLNLDSLRRLFAE
ncbi:MAG: HAD family phosphatase [Acidobacteriia bacterium]|nr:HAD family phosphatase [Terriglobia bacterium]